MIAPLTLRPPTPPPPVAAYDLDYLVIAGGGGGTSAANYVSLISGGAGGYKSGQLLSATDSVYTVYIGAGGAAGGFGLRGGGSLLQSSISISTLGGGSSYRSVSPLISIYGDGGSGGGLTAAFSGQGILGQGNPGAGQDVTHTPGDPLWGIGGGGGAGESGGIAKTTAKGGDGLTWLDGVTRGGGAGGWRNTTSPFGVFCGEGGAGGGGRSACNQVTPIVNATAGAANSGGGGGTNYFNDPLSYGTAQPGGSGIVKVRYAGTPRATGGTITQDGGFTYHEFTSSGRLIFTS